MEHLDDHTAQDIIAAAPIPRPCLNHHILSLTEKIALWEEAQRIQLCRKLRETLFNRNILGEPAWDLLLALYVIDKDRRRSSLRHLCELARLPLTTALRWLDYLAEQSLVLRLPHPHDRRAIHIELSAKGRSAMDDYLRQVRDATAIGSPTRLG